jgi:hypothetical protein
MSKTLKKPRKVENSKGQVFYGRHMYPGVAEYRPSRNQMFRLLIKEPAIRKMGTTFPGRPVFVHHNEHFSDELDKLRTEADGWVSDSFYNEADGNHWAKVILVTDRAIKAQANGYGLSNAYDFKRIDETGGVYNGLDYDIEILDGEYKHMALVPDPRYDSILLTPEEFKRYNEEQRAGLKRVANSNDKGRFMSMKRHQKTGSKFSLSLFKKTKVENSRDLAETSVLLPKSKTEMTIAELVEFCDGVMNSKKSPHICNASDIVVTEDSDGNEEEITVGELWEEVQDLRARVDEIESDVYEDGSEEDDVRNEDNERDDIENAEDDGEEDDNEVEDRSKSKKKTQKKAKNSREERHVFRSRVNNSFDEENDDEEDIEPKTPNRRSVSKDTKPKTAKNQRDRTEDRRESRKKADKARNAADRYVRENHDDNVIKISTPAHQLARGMEKYGQL